MENGINIEGDIFKWEEVVRWAPLRQQSCNWDEKQGIPKRRVSADNACITPRFLEFNFETYKYYTNIEHDEWESSTEGEAEAEEDGLESKIDEREYYDRIIEERQP